MRMLANRSGVGAHSTTRPAYITATSSVRPATTPRSWVIRIIAMWRRRCSRANRSRICAWMVTSSAVVGSSAIKSFDSHDSAIAIATRCREVEFEMLLQGLDQLRTDGKHRVERGHGVLKHDRERAAAQLPQFLAIE